MIPRLTTQGRLMMSLALQGTELKFTKLKIGSGAKPQNYTALTDVVNEVASIPVTIEAVAGEGSEGAGYVKLVGTTMRNTDFQVDFYYTELGVFVEDPDGGDDLLYAYAHYALSGDAEPVYVPVSSSTIVQLTPTVHVYVGDAENVTATISQATSYALKVDLQSHIDDHNNPHQVTKEQLGLGNVPNKSTNNQTPTYTARTSLASLVSGEKMTVAFGKIAFAVQSLIDHIGNKNNPHAVTAAQAGAAPTSHKSAATIYGVGDASNYGHVKLTDSYKGSSSAANGIAVSQKALNEVYKLASSKNETGSYTGTGTAESVTVDSREWKFNPNGIPVKEVPSFIIVFVDRDAQYWGRGSLSDLAFLFPRTAASGEYGYALIQRESDYYISGNAYRSRVMFSGGCRYDESENKIYLGSTYMNGYYQGSTLEPEHVLNSSGLRYRYVIIY